MLIHADLLRMKGLLVHQVNCHGTMARGLAGKIVRKWPQVYLAYRQAYDREQWKLGEVQILSVEAKVWVANLAGQDGYGTDKQYTDYAAYEKAWPKVYWWARKRYIDVYAPYKFGCGLGGGDWNIVRPLVEKLCPSVTWVVNDKGNWQEGPITPGGYDE